MKKVYILSFVLLLTACNNNECTNSKQKVFTPTIVQATAINECIKSSTGNGNDYPSTIIDKCTNMVLGIK
jgi:hypothetical protein